MNPNVPSQQTLENIVKFGVYYFPADKHYYSGTIVQCDKCLKSNLRACIGYGNLDLCLNCTDQVESRMSRINPPSIHFNPPMIGSELMQPSTSSSQLRTYMMDGAARPPMQSSQSFPQSNEDDSQLFTLMHSI